jgi:exodeoxyribonuclease VII large subunit
VSDLGSVLPGDGAGAPVAESAVDSTEVPPDDPIPSFFDLTTAGAKRRRSTRTRSLTDAARTSQLAFDLTPPKPKKTQPYQPIVLEPERAPVRVPVRPMLYTVRELINELRQHIEGAYAGLINVEGEVSNCRPAASGHLYFTLGL